MMRLSNQILIAPVRRQAGIKLKIEENGTSKEKTIVNKKR
ncbi:hypothetical protein HNP69_000991 [Chryseobacterium koreense]|nr:hypothetical protein [Chryseobacterium koreense]